MKARFDIVSHRRWFFIISSLITVAGLIVFFVAGFNLGPDFRAGSRVQMQLNQPATISQVHVLFTAAHIPIAADAVTISGTSKEIAVVRTSSILTSAQIAAINQFEKSMFPKQTGASVQTVDPIVAKQTSHQAIIAVLLASLFIVIYVAIRFEYRFAVSGIVALLHDAFIVMSVFALLHMEVDLLFVTAVLTIVGYSINDTIVIFDRIRENLKAIKPRSFSELERLVDKSLWQTMTRSISTVFTVLIAALMLYFFGGSTIHNFTFALIVGLISGAYSSIFIASPLWVAWRGRMYRKQEKMVENAL